MRRIAIPRAESGLPRPLERAVMRRYGKTTGSKMKTAGMLRALGVLLRRHPKAALDAAGAGVLQAGRVGVQDLTRRLSPFDPAARESDPHPRMSRRELLRFAKALERQSAREDAPER